MTRTLPRQQLYSQNATVEDRLRVCGALLWSEAALRRYQAEQENTAVTKYFADVRNAVLGYVSVRNAVFVGAVAVFLCANVALLAGVALAELYLSGKIIFHLRKWPSWQASNLLAHETYWRDGTERRLPGPVQSVVEEVRLFFPSASFAVSFLGQDPVLDAFINNKCYHALVWDEKSDGGIEIISPGDSTVSA